MSRIVRGALTLADEVVALRKDAQIEYGEADGLGVKRELIFDADTAAWLDPLLTELGDKRVVDHHVTEAGYGHVVFSPKPLADSRDPFNLSSADTVVAAENKQEKPAEPPKKQAAKRTPRKAAGS